MSVEWEDPPPPPSGRLDWGSITAELKANPGRWAKIGNTATRGPIYTRRRLAISVYGLDAVVRPNGQPDRFDVYARFLPAPDTETAA